MGTEEGELLPGRVVKGEEKELTLCSPEKTS